MRSTQNAKTNKITITNGWIKNIYKRREKKLKTMWWKAANGGAHVIESNKKEKREEDKKNILMEIPFSSFWITYTYICIYRIYIYICI